MALRLAFLGFNDEQTHLYFDELAALNAEQVLYYDGRFGRILLRDGTEIMRISKARACSDGLRYDQAILADDRRMDIRAVRAREIDWLRHCMAMSEIPPEFQFIIYDLDSEV